MTQVTNKSRRERGLRRLEVWVTEEHVKKLDQLCAENGWSRREQVEEMIDRDASTQSVASELRLVAATELRSIADGLSFSPSTAKSLRLAADYLEMRP